ncbi:MAG: hypothetical protein QXG67_04355 [Candidatus Nitrosotenuis sp.]|uniref:Uncharacterized protein n=1 Tax=Candidatus Nitrosotenuis uzonensis TaxID=1407055 RepID=A0A812ETG8_9ARCH|nr:hypothetical protein [Candidatus Nitrosotenuis uzonensis]MCA2003442.1 hypothetical protein [Candidatus Nitrosotenuis sp.]CAE6486316.1 conserved hypothetical protein [Candidatus Nitrosotenuis uzonensis]
MSFEGKRSLPVLFIIASVAIIAVFVASMYKDIMVLRETVTEEIMISGKLDDKCIIDTSDSIMSSKTIENCDLEVGAKSSVTYKKGLPTAELVKP